MRKTIIIFAVIALLLGSCGTYTGNGAYISNIYLTDAYVQFTPEQIEDLHGQDAYSVSLTRTEGSIIVDNEFNIITDY